MSFQMLIQGSAATPSTSEKPIKDQCGKRGNSPYGRPSQCTHKEVGE